MNIKQQVSKLAASAKSAEADFGPVEATAWFRSNAAVNVNMTFQVEGPGAHPFTITIPRIRLPAL